MSAYNKTFAEEPRQLENDPLRPHAALQVMVASLHADGRVYLTLRVRDLDSNVIVHPDRIDGENPKARKSFAAEVAAKDPQIAADVVERAVLALAAEIADELRREAAVQAKQEEEQGPTGGGQGGTQAAKLVTLAESWTLFHSPEGETYASLPGPKGELQTWGLHSSAVRERLRDLYWATYKSVPGSQAVQDALGVLAGQALFEGAEQPVWVRLAEHGARVYLDLCDATWTQVEISAQGWRLIPSAQSPVRFRRTKGLLPLPAPIGGGSLKTLRTFVNVPKDNDDDWRLLVAWLLAALRGRGPYPILNLVGEQGAAKSTTQRVLRALVDPHRVMLCRPPRDERDLMISATNNWVVSYENLSHLPDWLSDALCALATGGGFRTKKLYEDAEETLFDAQRPVALNGIPLVAARGDILDRSLVLQLQPISETERRAERGFWADFESERPALLGALLDIMVAGLEREASVVLPRLPRMADFCLWVTACEPALGWEAQSFLDLYDEQRAATHEVAVQTSVVAQPLWDFMRTQPLKAGQRTWEGTASRLLEALNKATEDAVRRRKGWPTLPHQLSGELTRLAPDLRPLGLRIETLRLGKAGTRILRLSLVEKVGKTASAASAASADAQMADADAQMADADAQMADADAQMADADAQMADAQADAQRGAADAQLGVADAADALLHTSSKPNPNGSGPEVLNRPDLPCHSCKGTRYWLRPPEAGGGPVCMRCHPPGDHAGAQVEGEVLE